MKRMERSKKQGLTEMVNNSRHSDFFIVLDDEVSAKECYIQQNIELENRNEGEICGRHSHVFLPFVKPHSHINDTSARIIYAHKVVLEANSTFFKNILYSPFFENRNCYHINCCDEICWGTKWDIEPFKKVFVLLLKLIYTGKLSKKSVTTAQEFGLLCRLIDFFGVKPNKGEKFPLAILRLLSLITDFDMYCEVLRIVRTFPLMERLKGTTVQGTHFFTSEFRHSKIEICSAFTEILQAQLLEILQHYIWGRLRQLVKNSGCSTFLKDIPSQFLNFNDFEGYCHIVELINENREILHSELISVFQSWFERNFKKMTASEFLEHQARLLLDSTGHLSDEINFFLCVLSKFNTVEEFRDMLCRGKIDHYWNLFWPFDLYKQNVNMLEFLKKLKKLENELSPIISDMQNSLYIQEQQQPNEERR